MATVKHFFPGGNTSSGFYSFYDYILGQEEATRIFCIKGGPGTGKSSLMKRLGEYFYEQGYDIEFHHCSSDNNSLDGVVIKPLNVAFLDGTAPHVVDPKNPGAVDEVLHMGDFWDEPGFAENKFNVINTNVKIGLLFDLAYNYLAAANDVEESIDLVYSDAINNAELNVFKTQLAAKIFAAPKVGYTEARHLFGSAFTPNGIVSYVDNNTEGCNTVYTLTNAPQFAYSAVLEHLLYVAEINGVYAEVFHYPLNKDKIEYIVFPELGVAVTSSNIIGTPTNTTTEYDLAYLFDIDPQIKALVYQFKDDVLLNINKAISLISTAKTTHDLLETYYIPNMDFGLIDDLFVSLVERIEGYAE